MTVAFDAWTPSDNSGSANFTTTSPATFTHTPVGTPRAVLVFIGENAASADVITAVTYGGVSMTRVPTNGLAQDSAGEVGAIFCYFLGSSIPTGAQTVSITHTGSADVKFPVCITLTAAADTEIGASGKLEGDQADPQIALDTGATESLRFAAVHSGQNTLGNLSPVTDVSATLSSARFDYGSQVALIGRQTSAASSGSFTIGWTALSEDVAMVAVAVQETAGGQTVTAVTLTTTPTLPQARLDHRLTAATLSATPTLPQARVDHRILAAALSATPTLPAATITAERTATAVTLTVTPTFPTATVTAERTATAVTLTVTPTLPQAALQHSLTAAILSATPTLPQASLAVQITAATLTATPTFPQATVSGEADLTAVTLVITPSLPQASVQLASIAAQTLTVTPTLPQAEVAEAQPDQVLALTLTLTPTLPQASITQALAAQALSATPTFPQASIGHSITAGTLTLSPVLPAATLVADAEILAQTLITSPALPVATVVLGDLAAPPRGPTSATANPSATSVLVGASATSVEVN